MAPKKRPLVDSLDLCSAGVQKQNIKRKQLDRRDTEQAVERILNEHFAGFTRAQTDVMTVDGLTLRQTLIDRKRDKKGDAGSRLGTKLYSELGRAFALESSPVRALQVKDLSETVQPSLYQALKTAQDPNPAKRSKQPLYNFFSSVKDLNQKETVGLLRSISESAHVKGTAGRLHAFEVLKFIINSGLDKKFPEEISIMASTFDETLAGTFEDMTKEHMPMATWWQNFSKYVRVLGCFDDFTQIMDELNNWSNVASQLQRVVTGTLLGRKMFGGASSIVLLTDFSNSVDAQLAIMKQAEFTKDAIVKCKDTYHIQS